MSKEDGIYADPEDETAFYVCEGEKPTKKFCPTGLKFNPVISGCDVAEDVKYVGNEGDSSGTSSSKENTRWTSLPGNEGLKVFSVGGRLEPRKDDAKTVSKAPPPHKLFSINIFNGAHSQTTKKLHEGRVNNAVNNERFQGNVQNNAQNIPTMGSKPKENYRKLESASADAVLNVQDRLRNGQNKKISETPSMFMAQKMESADNNSLSLGSNTLEGNHHGESSEISQDSSSLAGELNPKIPVSPASHRFSSKRPESSDNRRLQVDQDVGNTNSLQGHLGPSPHKLFAINIYGSHPQAPNNGNEMHTSDQNRLSGVHEFELADQYRDTSSSNTGHRILAGPLGFQSDQGDALNTPGLKSVSEYQQESQPYADLGTKTVEENIFSANDSTATPLHFKLKVNMDNSGKQPVINCTLSECSENDFAIEDYKIAEKGSESHPNGSINESTEGEQTFVDHHDNHGSQMTKEGGDFQVTLTTDTSKPVAQPQGTKEMSVAPNQLTRPLIALSNRQPIKNNLPQLEDTSQTMVQSSHSSLSKEAQEDVFSPHRNGTTAQTVSESSAGNGIKTQDNDVLVKGDNVNEHGESNMETKMATNRQEKMSYGDREENKMRAQDNTETLKGDKVIQHGERDDEVKAANLQKSPAGESSVRNSSVVNEHNARKLENANQIPSNENNFSAEDERDEQKENFFNNKLKTSSQGNSLTNQLENNNIKNQFHEQGQLNSQDFVQIQSHPQLKIILKNPGKIINSLKRRSDAKGHIVQILKSLIDRPLKLGSKNKDVVSMLSTLVKKQVQGQKREKTPQDDSEDIKDSGSIAESILEANKEYLDAIAMQGMVFSDGDPETENMTNVVDSYQGHGYQQQKLEGPPLENPDAEGKGDSTGPQEKSPHDGALQEDWLNDEHLITPIKGRGGDGK